MVNGMIRMENNLIQELCHGKTIVQDGGLRIQLVGILKISGKR